MRDEDITSVVKQTIQSLPDEYKTKLSNLAITVQERQPVQMLVHEQYIHTQEHMKFYTIAFPDKITIYKIPLLRISPTLEDARGHLKDAIIKEISKYFGISEFELRRVRNSVT